jgi:hypothetical protein
LALSLLATAAAVVVGGVVAVVAVVRLAIDQRQNTVRSGSG